MIRLRGFIFLVFASAFLFGISASQLHAADWTKVKMTSENIQQLAGLRFVGKLHGIRMKEMWIDPNPTHLRISHNTQTARFRGGGGNARKYNFKTQIGMRDGMLMMLFQRAPRLFTVERNGAGKFRISAKYSAYYRDEHTNYTLVFNQQ